MRTASFVDEFSFDALVMAFARRLIGFEGIAVGQMAEGCEHIIFPIAPDGADDVGGLARRDLGAFHKRQVAAGRARSTVWKLARA